MLAPTPNPFDPELVAAVEEVFRRFPLPLVQIPSGLPREQRPPMGGKAKKKQSLARRDGAACVYCGCEFADLADATIDHIIPWSVCHISRRWNLVLACGPCNEQKDNLTPAAIACLMIPLIHQLVRLREAPAERGLVLRGGDRGDR